MRAVCLQHVPFEGPGAFAEALSKRGIALERWLVPSVGLPAEPADMLIVMGGPVSVNDPEAWITEEIAYIRSALSRGTAIIGVCLGSQFMAKALGATVRPGTKPEIGMMPVSLTPEARQDRFLQDLPESVDVFEWHGEIFDPPHRAVTLARSSAAPVQAFRYGERAYGLLFHLEIDAAGIEALCRECPQDLADAGLTAQQLKDRALPHLPRLHRLAERLAGQLVDSCH
ncbi:MAG TPA: type 1 glutamine amidotransferase [Nitrospira sp.]|nr:type 1 glutamine amidotransferase [Nitrospira sp.]